LEKITSESFRNSKTEEQEKIRKWSLKQHGLLLCWKHEFRNWYYSNNFDMVILENSIEYINGTVIGERQYSKYCYKYQIICAIFSKYLHALHSVANSWQMISGK
jgi:hypothetical protein